MLKYPDIDPIALSIGPISLGDWSVGPLDIHWYGVMYLCAFASAWYLALKRCKPGAPLLREQAEDLIFYGALGVVIGGRVGYVFFYNFEQFLIDPLWLFKIWDGGMSFHGGMLGVIVAVVLYARKLRVTFLRLMDFVAPIVPLGLGFGRLGNFIGQELWGRPTSLPWGMVFPKDPGIARHPSQLYQAFLEGLVLFAVLWWFSSKPRARGAVSGLFLILYGCFRIVVEFAREPDSHIQFDLFGWVTRGQLLSLPMIALGVGLLVWAKRREGKI